VEIPPAGDKSKGKAHKRYEFGGKANVATEAEIPYLTMSHPAREYGQSAPHQPPCAGWDCYHR